MPPEVTTVVLNHRSAADTERCVEALATSSLRSQQLVVVDNGSGDEEVERLHDHVGTARLVISPDNTGYAGGNNLGIRLALEDRTDFVWILNPDVVVTRDALAHLVGVMRGDPAIGILGPRITNGGSRPLSIWYDGGAIDLSRGGATSHVHSGVPVSSCPPSGPVDTDYVTGAAMLVRREVFEQVGLLPEEYFLYFEETEFNLLAQDAGWRTVVAPEALVHHHKRSSGALPSPYYVYYFVRSRLRFGQRFSGLSLDEVLTDLQQWIGAWDEKVRRADPEWLPTYRRLVDAAVSDARAGRIGPRDLAALTVRDDD